MAHPISENLLNIMRKLAIFVYLVMLMMGASRHGFFYDFLEGFEWKIRKIPNSKIYIHSTEAMKMITQSYYAIDSICTLYVGR